MAIQRYQLSPGQTLDTSTCGCMTASWDPNDQQELFLTQTNGTQANDIYAQITTFDSGNVAKGIPYFGKTAVDITAAGASVARNIKTVIPLTSGFAANTTNYAAAANGGVVSVSSQFSASYPAGSAIDGSRTGQGWGSGTGGWNDGTNAGYPDSLQVAFSGAKTISEIDVYTLADAFPLASDPTPTTPAGTYGITDFQVQYDNGSGWKTVPGGSVTGNALAWRKFTFAAISGVTKIQVQITKTPTAGGYEYSRIVELEAY